MKSLERLVRILISPRLAWALLAFAAMGAWALFVNAGANLSAAASAGVMQGALSAAYILALPRILLSLGAGAHGFTARIAPRLIAAGGFLVVLMLLLFAFGAPQILRTIAPPALMGLALALAHPTRKSD